MSHGVFSPFLPVFVVSVRLPQPLLNLSWYIGFFEAREKFAFSSRNTPLDESLKLKYSRKSKGARDRASDSSSRASAHQCTLLLIYYRGLRRCAGCRPAELEIRPRLSSVKISFQGLPVCGADGVQSSKAAAAAPPRHVACGAQQPAQFAAACDRLPNFDSPTW